MVQIVDAQLSIEHVRDHPGERRLVVEYEIAVPPDDGLIGEQIDAEAVVAAIDEHDAPVLPARTTWRIEGAFVLDAAGSTRLRLERTVHRADLDVEGDWWRTDLAGGTEPIAEFPDHLAAIVTLRAAGVEVATATTPVITGSWGALGDD